MSSKSMLGSGVVNLHGVEDFVPAARDFAQNLFEVCCAIARSNSRACSSVFGLPQEEHHFGARARAQFNRGLQCGAGIQAGAYFSGKRNAAFKPGRTLGGSVAAEKFRAVAVNEVCFPRKVRKGDAAAKFAIPGTPGKNRSRLRIHFRDDVRRRSGS